VRLRYIASALGVCAFIGLLGFMYAETGQGNGKGEGGLPLVRADQSPVKIPPNETQRDPLNMPDSTIFETLAPDAQQNDMAKLVPPAETPAQAIMPISPSPEFAGFRTGFALPDQPKPKTENLFETIERKSAAKEAQPEAKMAQPRVTPPAMTQADTPQAATTEPIKTETAKAKEAPAPPARPMPTAAKQETVKKPEPALKHADAPKPRTPAKAKPEAKADSAAQTAKQMERQELDYLTEPYSPRDANRIAPKAGPSPMAKANPAASGGGHAHFIQLTSAPSQAAAEAAWREKQARHTAALAGLTHQTQRVTINGRDYFRLQAGPMSAADAERRCAQIRAQAPGTGCLVLRR